MKNILVLLILVFLVACQGDQADQRQKLYDDVMAIHDEAMADMGKINALTEALKDSLEIDTLSQPKRTLYQSTLDSLALADSLMWKWMHNFDQEAASEFSDTAVSYLEKEEKSIKYVQKVMEENIQAAQKIVNE